MKQASAVQNALVLAGYVAAALSGSPVATQARATDAILSFRSPFDAQQCQSAGDLARRRLQRSPADRAARWLLGEALLCAGLDGSEVALVHAIRVLTAVAASDHTNFYAQLELADAWRKQYPASLEAYVALIRVRRLLKATDAGAARADLREYVSQNLAAVRDQRARDRAFLRSRLLELGTRNTPDDEIVRVAAILDQMGPRGAARELRLITTAVERGTNERFALVEKELFALRKSSAQACAVHESAPLARCHGPPGAFQPYPAAGHLHAVVSAPKYAWVDELVQQVAAVESPLQQKGD